MLNGHSSPASRHNRLYAQWRKRASGWLRGPHTAAELAGKVPLVVGAIVVLLCVNTALQYAAGPALHRALGGSSSSGSTRSSSRGSAQTEQEAAAAAAAAGLVRHIPQGLVTDVVPGGADAELLCVDKLTACDKDRCSRVSVKYQDCKATCAACETLRASVQSDTGLQIRVVQQLSACQDLHPKCDTWAKGGRCGREPKAMLELCQASCSFCQQQAVSPLAAGATGSDTAAAAVLLDECQDDINVCPFLAASGLCSSSSLWVETQCARSCGHCSTQQQQGAAANATTGAAAGSLLLLPAHDLAGTQQQPDSSSSSSSSSGGAATTASLASVPDVVQGSASVSSVVLRGRHHNSSRSSSSSVDPGGPVSTQAMQEWHIPGCADHQERCASWAQAGECSRNVDFMLIACKAACGNCRALQTPTPFATVQLASGWPMPAVGFGTAGLGVGTAAAVEYAAAAGYRMFDSAESKDWYDEEAVGAGLAASKVPRQQLFLTSKIHPRDLGFNQTLAAFGRALKHLRTDYLDLLLLHYPTCFPSANCIPAPHQTWQESWRALELLVGQGKVRSIGVSNFGLSELQELLTLSKVAPSVLQGRSDPFAINHHALQWALKHNVTFIGYSTLGTQWINSPVSVNPVFNSSLLKAVAARHPGKSVAQVVLRWALQLGQVVIPRSSNTDHIPSNRLLFDFSLTDAEMQAVNSLDGSWKTGGLPLPVA